MSQTSPFLENISKEMVVSSTAHVNVGQDVIATTEDRIRLCLYKHERGLAARDGWVAPVSLVVTILLVLVTSDFHNFAGLSKETWQAVFLISCGLAVIWSIAAIWKAFSVRTSVDSIITELKRVPLPDGASSGKVVTPDQAHSFFENVKGEWHLDYSRGQEDINIDENGNYFTHSLRDAKAVSTTNRPSFHLKLLSSGIIHQILQTFGYCVRRIPRKQGFSWEPEKPKGDNLWVKARSCCLSRRSIVR